MSERSKGPCGFPLSIREYVQAAWSIATGQFMTVGDSPLADLKEQTTNMSTNIGLMSALVLTMIVPIMYDAGLGPQNNSYMVTDPFWVGSLYFALACSASWTFAISTVFAVLNIMALNETGSSREANHFVMIASTELRTTSDLFTLSWVMLVGVVVLWASIVCFDLSGNEDCDESCNMPGAFAAMIVTCNAISAYACFRACSLIAKLYKCKENSPIVSWWPRPPNALTPTADWIHDPTTQEVLGLLSEYLARDKGKVTPTGFKEYLINSSSKGAGALSYLAERTADRVFERAIDLMIDSDLKHCSNEDANEDANVSHLRVCTAE